MDFERLFTDSLDFVCCVTPQGYVLEMNKQWRKQLGWSEQVLLSRPVHSFVHAEDSEFCADALLLARDGHAVSGREWRLMCSDSAPIWASWTLTRIGDGIIGVTACDINEIVVSRQALDEQTQFLEMAAGIANFGCWEYDPVANETNWSDGLCSIFGVEPGDARISPEFSRSRLHPTDREAVRLQHESAWNSGEPFEYHARLFRMDGEMRHVHSVARYEEFDQPGKDSCFFGVTTDVTDQVQAIRQIEHTALHDPLTDLPNRKNFSDRLTEALHQTERFERRTVLVLIDLDHFKDVNDSLGHPVGDALLIQAANRIKSSLHETESIARLGGDEFAILQAEDDQPRMAEDLCARVSQAMQEAFEVHEHSLTVSCSIGVALAPDDGKDAEELMRNADIALYKAKTDGRGVCRFFEQQMDTRQRAQRQLETELRKAISNNEFELYFQPVLDTQTEVVTSMEALIRWNSPDRGMVPPLDFIPLAEQTGLIVPIGAWVMRQACAEAATWPENVSVAVNVSAAEFKSDRLLESITSAIGDAKLNPMRLEIEVTESALLSDADKTLEVLHALREIGVKIVMDDFGVGYSSLSYLRSFPFDKLKLDGSFVKESASRSDDRAIVSAVAGIARALGVESTAEGVETKDHMEVICAEGYGQVQGYLHSRPKPAKEIFAEYFSDAPTSQS